MSVESYTTAPFRDPRLFGVPVFSVGVDDYVTYEGQYIHHVVKTVSERGKNRTYWVITLGMVALHAKHAIHDFVLPVMVNGVACPTVAELLTNRNEFHFIEDVKPIKELEVPQSCILNLGEVQQSKSPALLIDPHNVLSKIPRDVFRKYNELKRANKQLQTTVYEMSSKISELIHQIEMYNTERLTLMSLLEELTTKYKLMSASLMQLRLNLLQSKDRQKYLEKALQNATSTKEKWELLSKELLSMTQKFGEAVKQVEENLNIVEKTLNRLEEEKVKLEERIGGEGEEGEEKEGEE